MILRFDVDHPYHRWTRALALGLLIAFGTLRAFPAPVESLQKPTTTAAAKTPKTWVTFENCTYVADSSNDADSFKVRCGKRTLHVRLYFVDAPESNRSDPDRVLEQSLHFGITPEATLEAGKRALEVTRQLLSQPFTVHTRWTVAGGRSRQPRYYSIIETRQGDLGSLLVGQGLARAKGAIAPTPSGEPSKSVTQRLSSLESTARQRRAGAWGLRSSSSENRTRTAPAPPSPSPASLKK
ncbi:MAG: thermonuclease family protein [Limisphaerales bacterium]